MSNTNRAAKFSPMSAEQFAALKDGDMVTAKSGNTYRFENHRAWEPGTAFFVGQRNGKNYGPSRVMSVGSVAAVAPVAAPAVDVAALRASLGLESRMYSDERVLQIAARVATDEARLAAR